MQYTHERAEYSKCTQRFQAKKGQPMPVTCESLDKHFPFAERVETCKAFYRILRQQPNALRRYALYAVHGDTLGLVKFVLGTHRLCQVEAFAEVCNDLPDALYWHLLGHIFWTALNHDVYHDVYLRLMRAPRPEHMLFHNPTQLEGWQNLPERVMIFRGHGQRNSQGLWYSMNWWVSADYATQHGRAGKVSSYMVSKHDLFYLGGKQEAVAFVQGLGSIPRTPTVRKPEERLRVPYDEQYDVLLHSDPDHRQRAELECIEEKIDVTEKALASIRAETSTAEIETGLAHLEKQLQILRDTFTQL